LTVSCLADDHFLLLGSGAMQEAHRRWFEMRLPPSGVSYRNLSPHLHGIGISGPKSRELLDKLCRDDVSAAAFKFRDVRESVVAGVPAILARISFSGELGYEVYVAPRYQLRLAEAIEEEGTPLGLRWYGARTLMSLRLEKGWGAWALDYRPDFTAAESGLDIFIDWDKEFVGKAAALAEKIEGPQKRLVTLIVHTHDIDVSNDEAILHDGKAVGYVSSGGYAHHVDKSLALGYVPAALANAGTTVNVEINGEMVSAEVQGQALYDANGGRMRS
jgi:dimethylglycine dehydrogenase